MGLYQHNISVAILAGGENRRFGGESKAFLLWDEEPLIHRYLRLLSPLTDDLMVISNAPGDFSKINIAVFPDIIPGKGPLSGIHAALANATKLHILILACDMPFLSLPVISGLINAIPQHPDKVIIPGHDGGLEPLMSIWPSSLHVSLQKWLISQSQHKIMHYLTQHNIHDVLQLNQELIIDNPFMNINSKHDLASARNLEMLHNKKT